MRTHRKDEPIPSRQAIQTYEVILRGIYYRHEFARRDRSVVAASELLLNNFAFPPGRGRTFIGKGSPTCLTSELMEQSRASDTVSASRRKALTAFLRDYSIIPTGEMETPFFPEAIAAGKATFTEMVLIWNSLLRFEYFALAQLDMALPVLFPVMQIGVLKTKDGATTYRLQERVTPGKQHCLLLMDMTAPQKTVDAYVRMMRMQERVTKARSEKMEDESEYARSRPVEYPAYLAAYDLDLEHRQQPKGVNPDNTDAHVAKRQVDLVNKFEAVISWKKRKKKKKAVGAESKRIKFHKWLGAARVLIKDYRQII